MTAQILDGKTVRDQIAQDLKAQISKLDQKPELVIFQVGDVAQSNTYIAQKIKFGEKIGAIVTHKKLPDDTPQHELVQEIQLANEDQNVNGIIVQLPIPKSLDKEAIIESISPQKDVDGQTAKNLKLLFEGSTHVIPGSEATPESTKGSDSGQARMTKSVKFGGFIPATTQGILTLLNHYKIPISGKRVVIVGRSTLVGKPTALALLNADATVTVAHSKTDDLPSVTKSADILISAVGKANLITKDHVSTNQTVVDVGINVIDETSRKLVGDVDFENVKDIVGAISPVPGGAGPMTVASLFQNLLKAYKTQNA